MTIYHVDRRIGGHISLERLGMLHVQIERDMVGVADHPAQPPTITAAHKPVRTDEREHAPWRQQRERTLEERNVDVASFGERVVSCLVRPLFLRGDVVKTDVGRIANHHVELPLKIMEKEIFAAEPTRKQTLHDVLGASCGIKPCSDLTLHM